MGAFWTHFLGFFGSGDEAPGTPVPRDRAYAGAEPFPVDPEEEEFVVSAEGGWTRVDRGSGDRWNEWGPPAV